MGTLIFKKVTESDLDRRFDCGNISINNYIKESYYPLITQQAYTYSIMDGKTNSLLGFCQFMFREIQITKFPDDISEYFDEIKEEITAVHIRFIAIDCQYQKKHLGTAVMKSIIKHVKKLSRDWPIRVITIDSVILNDQENNLVKWYKSLGFKELMSNTPGQDGVTVAMYFDCMNFSDELKAYVNKFGV